MRKEIEACAGCKVLSFDVIPIVETSTRVTPLTSSLMERFPGQLTWMLAINDLYFDFAVPALRAAGAPPAGPPNLVSGGDGSVSAYGRIRAGQYQVATVPEPLNLQGWMAVDELNRAFAGQPWSGYVTAVHLVTKDNVDEDGGKDNHFDPDNGYRDHYKAIWSGSGS
jgi:ribose transport system substrate-binding protein